MVCKYLLSNPLKAVAIVVGGDEEGGEKEEIDKEEWKYKVDRIEEKDVEGIYVVPIFRVVIREGERGGNGVEETFVEKVLGMQVEGGGVNVTVEAKNKEDADEIIIEWLKGLD